MPQTCTICRHPDRDGINAALIAGEPYRRLAARTGTTSSSLRRHKTAHLPVVLTKAAQAAEVVQADRLLDQLEVLQRETLGILAMAKAAGDLRTALFAVMQARENAELLERCREKERDREKTERLYPAAVALRADAKRRAQLGAAARKLLQLYAAPGSQPNGAGAALAASTTRQLPQVNGHAAEPAAPLERAPEARTPFASVEAPATHHVGAPDSLGPL